jgi:hypothetical protein
MFLLKNNSFETYQRKNCSQKRVKIIYRRKNERRSGADSAQLENKDCLT